MIVISLRFSALVSGLFSRDTFSPHVKDHEIFHFISFVALIKICLIQITHVD